MTSPVLLWLALPCAIQAKFCDAPRTHLGDVSPDGRAFVFLEHYLGDFMVKNWRGQTRRHPRQDLERAERDGVHMQVIAPPRRQSNHTRAFRV
jgi:hypothetical protein